MSYPNATLINLFHICHRQLWLHANGIRMEQTSDVVQEGKWIGETTYEKRSTQFKELEIAGSKIDFYDPKNKVVHETKKSDKAVEAHRAQVKYYLWLLEQEGVEGATGILEYPKQRRRETVELEKGDHERILEWISKIEKIIEDERCPEVINKPICRTCSYYNFCYAGG